MTITVFSAGSAAASCNYLESLPAFCRRCIAARERAAVELTIDDFWLGGDHTVTYVLAGIKYLTTNSAPADIPGEIYAAVCWVSAIVRLVSPAAGRSS